ncbi:MAG: hypothetical protein ABIH23_16810 [bacterium]
MPRKKREETMTEQPTIDKPEVPVADAAPIVTEASSLVRTIHANAMRGLRVIDFDELTVGEDLIARLPKEIGGVEVCYVQWGMDNYPKSDIRSIAVPLTRAVYPKLDSGLLNHEGFVQNGDLIVLVMAKETRDNWKKKKRAHSDKMARALDTESVRKAQGEIVPELGSAITGEVRANLKPTNDIYAT